MDIHLVARVQEAVATQVRHHQQHTSRQGSRALTSTVPQPDSTILRVSHRASIVQVATLHTIVLRSMDTHLKPLNRAMGNRITLIRLLPHKVIMVDQALHLPITVSRVRHIHILRSIKRLDVASILLRPRKTNTFHSRHLTRSPVSKAVTTLIPLYPP